MTPRRVVGFPAPKKTVQRSEIDYLRKLSRNIAMAAALLAEMRAERNQLRKELAERFEEGAQIEED